MAVQILLQGSLAGVNDFLLAAPAKHDNRAFEARLQWTTLLGETLPRALLAHLPIHSMLIRPTSGSELVNRITRFGTTVL